MRIPGADWQGEHGVSRMKAWRRVTIHTIVGDPPAHAAHTSVRGDGWLYQSRDTDWQSAACLEGNHDSIAVECDDHGPEFGNWNVKDGHAVPGFTPAQIETIAKLCVWAHRTYGIPLVLCPDSRPGSRGIAYHRQGIDGNWSGYAYGGRVSGGERWSTSSGKVCPGDRRIRQLIEQIIPRARVLAGLDQEDDMAGEGANILAFTATGGPSTRDVKIGSDGKVTLPAYVDPTSTFGRVVDVQAALTSFIPAVKAELEQLGTLQTQMVADLERLATRVEQLEAGQQ